MCPQKKTQVYTIRTLPRSLHFKLWNAKKSNISAMVTVPVDTGRKLNLHKTFRRRPGRPLNVLCTFNLRPVSIGFKKWCSNRTSIISSFLCDVDILPTSFSHYWDTMSLFWSIEFSFRRFSSVWYIRWRT